ncbi:MAG: glycosyltransferase family 4 protein [Spirochaetales bacterium]|nr:glycosyltransferase family 4 protein [Spirochaetales bacterium]
MKSLAYLASEYPGISHTFIYREIISLREKGFHIDTFSIRKPSDLERMTSDDRQEAENTTYIKTSGTWTIISSLLHLLLTNPVRFFPVLMRSLKRMKNRRGGRLKGLAYFVEAALLLRQMKINANSHVHVHFGNPAATVAMIASEFGTITFSMSIHGPDLLYEVYNNALPEKITKAEKVRCISHYSRSQLMNLTPFEQWDKFQIVRCGIDPDIFAPREEPQAEKIEILCLGRLVPAKGQHILIKACFDLKKRGIDFHTTIVGGGSDRESLEKLSAASGLTDDITFTGPVSRTEVLDFYRNTHIFVLPSFAEGVPVVLMEAMAMGVPVISTNITGIPELITHGKEGLLALPSDHIGLADQIAALANDRDLRMALGRNGREKVIAEYNLNLNTKDMADFFSFV